MKSVRCKGKQFLERGAALFFVARHDHGPHVRKFLFAEEHVLGAAQADALGAECPRLDGVSWNVGVGPHSHRAERLRPAHELHQFGIVGLGVKSVEFALDHAAGGAVERNPVARFEHLALDLASRESFR